MNVLMICGTYPPEVCGIGDYTARLSESLVRIGLRVMPLPTLWNMRSVARIVESASDPQYDIVHIQYPGVGYGHSLVPQILSVKVPAVVTLHEFSHVKLLRRIACLPFLFSARQMVFTSEYELANVMRFFPWIANKSVAIPIGTNIIPVQTRRPRNFNEVIYFGLIAPRKGIEQVLQFAAYLEQEKAGFKIRLIGQVPSMFRDYADSLIEKAQGLPVTWTLGKSDHEVAELLSRASVAYLPFPDGASERRGTLKAALSSGVVCVSTEGEQTSDTLRGALTIASDGREALTKIRTLLGDRVAWERASAASMMYSESFHWDHIARSHLQVYAKLLERNG
ncbi:MAG: glycosyltransferase family 4 protein [Terracidiphilus sp.]